MKKFKIVFGALALAVMAFVIIACTKEKEMKSETAENNETVSMEDDMSAYLKQFKERMQSASKGGEILSLEDACWHLEAVLNYTYGDARHQISDLRCDTFYYKLPTAGEDVSLACLNEAFNSLSNDVENCFTACDLPDKSILAIQTKFENDSKNGDILVQAILNTRGFISSNLLNMWFDSTDYWHELYYDYGWGYVSAGGKCGPYVGNSPESGAPLELTRKLNLRIPGYDCSSGSSYYTDIFVGVLSIESNDFDIDFLFDDNSPCQFKLYYRTENPEYPWLSNPGGCICPEDMNYYLSKGPELINHYQPEGKVIMGAYYQSNELVGMRYANCFHELVLKYGALHCNGAAYD